MKTTVDRADDLLLRAKREAEASQTTLRSLIEEGLREVLGRQALSKHTSISPPPETPGPSPGAPCTICSPSSPIRVNYGVAELWTADRDASLFPELKTRNPLIAR